MILMTESEEVIRLLPECHALLLGNLMKIQKNVAWKFNENTEKMTIKMAYEVIMGLSASYAIVFVGTFTEYP